MLANVIDSLLLSGLDEEGFWAEIDENRGALISIERFEGKFTAVPTQRLLEIAERHRNRGPEPRGVL